MKFGKFEVSEFCIGSIALIVLILGALHYVIEEERLKEQTEQLRIQENIIRMEQGEISNE